MHDNGDDDGYSYDDEKCSEDATDQTAVDANITAATTRFRRRHVT